MPTRSATIPRYYQYLLLYYPTQNRPPVGVTISHTSYVPCGGYLMKTEVSRVPAIKPRPNRRTRLRRELVKTWRQRWLYVLVMPAIISTFIFNYMPIYGLTLAFRDFDISLGAFRSPWAKPIFYNFWFLNDSAFYEVLTNTLKIAAIKFAFAFPAPIILALLLNEVVHNYYKRIVQTITYLPHFISWVIMAGLIYKLFDFDPTSPYNAVRAMFGLEPVNLMAQESAFIPILVVSNITKEVGWGTIIYLAAIMSIDPQLYEAAIVDGAGKWAQTRYITLPGMMPTISILLVLSIPGVLSAGFDQIYNLMNPMVARLANVTDIYVLRVGLQQAQYSFATALGLVFGVLGFTLTMIANRVSKTSGGSGIW